MKFFLRRERLKAHFSAFLLGPFDEPAFRIRLDVLQLFDIEGGHEGPKHPRAGLAEPLIQIKGSDQGFYRISTDPRALQFIGFDPMFEQAEDPQVLGQTAQAFPAHQFGTHSGQKTFLGFGELLIEMFGDHRVQNGISQKFQPLVAVSGVVPFQYRSMAKGLSEQLHISGPDTEPALKLLSELLLVLEGGQAFSLR